MKLVLRRAAEEKEKLEAQEQKLVEKRVKARHAMLLEKAMRDLKEYHAKLLNEELEKIKLENEEKARVKALKKMELALLKKTKTMLQLKKAKEKNKLFARKQSIQQGNDDNNNNNNNNIIGYFAAISGGLNTYNLCIKRRKRNTHNVFEMYDTVRGVVMNDDVTTNHYAEIVDMQMINDRYLITYSIKDDTKVKVLFDKRYFSKDDANAMVIYIGKLQAEQRLIKEHRALMENKQAMEIKKKQDEQKLNELIMEKARIMNQDNIKGYFAKYVSPNYHFCQQRRKPSARGNAFEMYNLYYGTVEDSKLDSNAYTPIKDVKPLLFKKSFVKSYFHNPAGMKVLYNPKYFTPDQRMACTTFMRQYEELHRIRMNKLKNKKATKNNTE